MVKLLREKGGHEWENIFTGVADFFKK